MTHDRGRIRRSVILATLLLLLLPCGARGQGKEGKKEGGKEKKAQEKKEGGQDVDKVVESLQKLYESTTDFQADFEQVYKHKVFDEEKKSGGKVFIKSPGKMRWEYKEPEKKLFVADGENLWVYEEKANQVTKQALAESDLPVAITFLVGKGKLKDEFACALVAHAQFASQGKVVVELTPKKATTQYKKLLLIVDGKSWQVDRTIVIDPSGNTNTLRFKNVKLNKGVPDAKFQFKPPKGATIVEP